MLDIERLNKYFSQYYHMLYNSEYGDVEAAIFTDMGDKLLKSKKYAETVQSLCKYRKDFISSDRESAAFALAVYRYEAEENYKRINEFNPHKKLKVTTFEINEGTASHYIGLKTIEDNPKDSEILYNAPNNWKTKKGAKHWAENHGYEFIEEEI